MRTFYEWTITVSEDGDYAIDHDRCEKLSGFAVGDLVSAVAQKGAELALVCEVVNSDDEIDDRFYAYVENGKLPQKFDDCGRQVPVRFHKELARGLADARIFGPPAFLQQVRCDAPFGAISK